MCLASYSSHHHASTSLIGTAQNKSRVAFSSNGVDILVAAESADHASLMSYFLYFFFGSDIELLLVLTVYFHGHYATIMTLHEGRDYRLRPTLSRLRYSLETGEIRAIQWINGQKNIADALTKLNTAIFGTVNRLLVKVC